MMHYAAHCDCASMGLSTATRFVSGALRPPVVAENYPDTPEGIVRAAESFRVHRQEERQARRAFYWAVHVGGRHVLAHNDDKGT